MSHCSCRPVLITYEEYCEQRKNCRNGCCFIPCPPPRPPCVPPCRPCGCKAGEYCFGYRGMHGEKVEVVLPIIRRDGEPPDL